MKKIFAAMIVLAIFTMGAFAQHVDWQKTYVNQNAAKPAVPKFNPKLYDLNTPKFVADAQQAYVFVDTLRDATFSLYGDLTPFVYEPYSNTLIFAGAQRNQVSQSSPLVGSLYIKYSTDEGKTWKKNQYYQENDKIPVWPSVAVTNTKKSTDPKTFNYVISGPIAENDGTGQYPWTGDIFLLVNGTTSADPLITYGPTSTQRWFWTRAAAAPVGNVEAFYNIGTLANSPGSQYGYYGSSSFDMKVGDWISQQIPPQWSVEKFRPSTQLNSSYQDDLFIDVDSKGNAYVGAKNMFADDPDNRVPAVSKSTDGGATWSEFDRMPFSLFTNYVTVMGGDPTKSGFIAYNSEGFVVTAEDEWHFAVRLFYNTSGTDYEYHIVDVYKQNGTWQMRKIGDFTGLFHFVMTEVGTGTAWKDSIEVNRLGNEVQIARTADGKNLVAKWMDYTGKAITVTPPVIISDGQDTISAVNVTDVFMAFKGVNDKDWSAPINVTNDDMVDKMTYIPQIVPSLSKVPLMTQRTFKCSYTDPNNPRNQYPVAVQQLILDYWQGTGMSMVSLTTTDIKQEQNVTFSVKDVYPNPASDQAELSFNLENASNVNIQMFNNLGQKVKTVLNDNVQAGINAVNIVTSDLINGSYYLRVTINGQTVTKTLNVIR